ncbi:hypothetical protein [Pseudoalteromonas marina]|uniref:hypothetical protein n=1 Tax=Pseudoalteromonas marina TaxID=267375 RepID=UPI003C5C37E8
MPKFKVPQLATPAVVKFKLQCSVTVPLLGEVVEVEISGARDDDGDGNPEVAYDIEILNRDVIEPGTVEIPLGTVIGAIEGIVAPVVSAALALAK